MDPSLLSPSITTQSAPRKRKDAPIETPSPQPQVQTPSSSSTTSTTQTSTVSNIADYWDTAEGSMYDWLRLFRLAAENIQNCICICDMTFQEHPICYVNRYFEAVTGYSRYECLGQNCRFLQGTHKYDEDIAQSRHLIKQTFESAQSMRIRVRNFRKNGEEFINLLSLRPLFDSKGRLCFYLSVQFDITSTLIRNTSIEEIISLHQLLSFLPKGMVVISAQESEEKEDETVKAITYDGEGKEKVKKRNIPTPKGPASDVILKTLKGAQLVVDNELRALLYLESADKGLTRQVEQLLQEGVPVDITDPFQAGTSQGFTALMTACSNSHLMTVELLLSRKAQVNKTSQCGWTAFALTMFYSREYSVIADLLLAHGADPDHIDGDGQTILMLLVQRPDFLPRVRYLLYQGASFDIMNVDGDSALHLAAATNPDFKMLSLLVEAGADPELKNKQGQTPLDCVPGGSAMKEKARGSISLGVRRYSLRQKRLAKQRQNRPKFDTFAQPTHRGLPMTSPSPASTPSSSSSSSYSSHLLFPSRP